MSPLRIPGLIVEEALCKVSSESSLPEALPNWRYRRRISASRRDDTFLYRDLLKRGRSLVIANIDDPGRVSVAQSVFQGQGTEDIDAAHKDDAARSLNLLSM